MKKVLLTALMTLIMCLSLSAQDYEWKKPPKPSETIIGTINHKIARGVKTVALKEEDSFLNKDTREYMSDETLYQSLLDYAEEEYGDNYKNLALRSFK
jgi:hypothetical protein